jgi:hypothetical protein
MIADRPLPTWPAWGIGSGALPVLAGLTVAGWTILLGLRHDGGARAAAWFAGYRAARLDVRRIPKRPVYLDQLCSLGGRLALAG